MKLFLDLDGVLFDFKAHFHNLFGVHTTEVSTRNLWRYVDSVPDFFRTIPPIPGASTFLQQVQHLSPVILTSCPHSNYESVAAQKRAAVREHFSTSNLILPITSGKYKYLFMDQPGDILVDDYSTNLLNWTNNGGHSILHIQDKPDAFATTFTNIDKHWDKYHATTP